MADVFISYSRKDIAFARILHDALNKNGLETWIDWQDIPPSVDWLAEVYEAIEVSDNFVFIISPTSVNSEICILEIEHAAKNNKRLIPIVVDDIDPVIVPTKLTHLNWIFFREGEEAYASAVKDLITAIQVDQSWVKAHTRLQNRALEWDRTRQRLGLPLPEMWILNLQHYRHSTSSPADREQHVGSGSHWRQWLLGSWLR
jgi:hypothetical protein